MSSSIYTPQNASVLVNIRNIILDETFNLSTFDCGPQFKPSNMLDSANNHTYTHTYVHMPFTINNH